MGQWSRRQGLEIGSKEQEIGSIPRQYKKQAEKRSNKDYFLYNYGPPQSLQPIDKLFSSFDVYLYVENPTGLRVGLNVLSMGFRHGAKTYMEWPFVVWAR